MVTAFEAARRVFRLDEAWDAVSALDLKIPAEAQLALYQRDPDRAAPPVLLAGPSGAECAPAASRP
jgi:hypothetical protein